MHKAARGAAGRTRTLSKARAAPRDGTGAGADGRSCAKERKDAQSRARRRGTDTDAVESARGAEGRNRSRGGWAQLRKDAQSRARRSGPDTESVESARGAEGRNQSRRGWAQLRKGAERCAKPRAAQRDCAGDCAAPRAGPGDGWAQLRKAARGAAGRTRTLPEARGAEGLNPRLRAAMRGTPRKTESARGAGGQKQITRERAIRAFFSNTFIFALSLATPRATTCAKTNARRRGDGERSLKPSQTCAKNTKTRGARANAPPQTDARGDEHNCAQTPETRAATSIIALKHRRQGRRRAKLRSNTGERAATSKPTLVCRRPRAATSKIALKHRRKGGDEQNCAQTRETLQRATISSSSPSSSVERRRRRQSVASSRGSRSKSMRQCARSTTNCRSSRAPRRASCT